MQTWYLFRLEYFGDMAKCAWEKAVIYFFFLLNLIHVKLGQVGVGSNIAQNHSCLYEIILDH